MDFFSGLTAEAGATALAVETVEMDQHEVTGATAR
jgi:hypothetical protein